MAHFAELDSNNIVTRVVVVGNDVTTAAGPLGENDMHVDGETWCVNFFKTPNWKQTSYNNNFRKQYAGKGFTYNSAKDKFISIQPHDSWTLDANDDWQAPVTYPTITTYGSNDPLDQYMITWDEAGQKWTATDHEDPINNFNWDASALAWVSA
tara:strand:- start:1067 stop:1525 length:459 start_codon:yes stop_codon:yes gene_type:complete